jgi:signal transduction histidine kinase
MRLSEREQRRLQPLARLQASGRLISSELVRENLLDMVVSEAAMIFDVPALAVLMPDEFGLEYIVHSAYGLSEKFTKGYKDGIPVMRESSSDVRRKPTVHNDLPDYVKNKDQAKLISNENLIRLLRVPLVMGTRMFGILALFSRDPAHYFSDEDIEVAQLLASQIVVALDNAELYNASEKRARELAEANRLRSQFLANISHELRTPMNSILGFSETMLGGLYGDLNEQQQSRMERIQRNGANLLALIDDLLDLSKIDAGRMEIATERVDIHELIVASIQGVEGQAQNKGVAITFDPPQDMPMVTADALRVRQIINNLVGNAVKFTTEGSVTISVESKDEVTLAPKPGQQEQQKVLWVSVTDTGIGISLEDQLIVFDEFRQVDGSTTRQFGGTGLGLAISKRLVELMGGRIWVDSEVGSGSTFTFVLPVADA